MKVIWRGTIFNLNAATVVELRKQEGDEDALYVGEHWDCQNDRGMKDILTGEPARRIWELYSKDAYNLDADLPEPELQPGDENALDEFIFDDRSKKPE